MTLYDIAAEIGRGLLAQLPSALLVALTATALTAFSRKRRRSRAQTEEDTDSSS